MHIYIYTYIDVDTQKMNRCVHVCMYWGVRFQKPSLLRHSLIVRARVLKHAWTLTGTQSPQTCPDPLDLPVRLDGTACKKIEWRTPGGEVHWQSNVPQSCINPEVSSALLPVPRKLKNQDHLLMRVLTTRRYTEPCWVLHQASVL